MLFTYDEDSKKMGGIFKIYFQSKFKIFKIIKVFLQNTLLEKVYSKDTNLDFKIKKKSISSRDTFHLAKNTIDLRIFLNL